MLTKNQSVIVDSISPSRRYGFFLGISLGLAAIGPVHANPPQTLKLTRIGTGPELARLESALGKAYGQLGIQIEYVDMPGERAIVESNSGRADGETARVAGMEISYPALRFIDVPLYINTNSIFVYGTNNAVPESLNQLSQRKRVGIITGWKASEEATAGWKNVVRVNSYGAALKMLQLGRLDAFLGRGEDTLRALEKEKMSLSEFPNKIVLRFPLFHYLNEKHDDLIPAITRELRKLQGEKGAVVESWLPLQ
jgi:polar amino acid transport system substrate-binding protein